MCWGIYRAAAGDGVLVTRCSNRVLEVWRVCVG